MSPLKHKTVIYLPLAETTNQNKFD